jgi:hypothetical protein
MVLVHNYALAVFFFVIAMTCWGSWANTQKLAAKNWRFELFYWDVVIGLLVFSLIAAFTLGSLGNEPGGRTFMEDLAHADAKSIAFSMLGGVIWNLGNLLLVAAIAVAGLAVGFPIGGGIAWLGGTILGFTIEIATKGSSNSNPWLLFTGMALAIIAIYLSMLSYKRSNCLPKESQSEWYCSFGSGGFVYCSVLYNYHVWNGPRFRVKWCRYFNSLFRSGIFCTWRFFEHIYFQSLLYGPTGAGRSGKDE